MEHLNTFVEANWVMILMWFFLLGMIINSFLKSSSDISPQQAVQIMSHENGSLVLDVREDAEFKTGHIKDSIHIPLGALKSRLNEIEKSKGKDIIVGCRSGSRSGRACSLLKKNGFEKVHNLRGGVIAWENDNLPMSKA